MSWPVETLSGGAEIEGGEGCTPADGAAGGGAGEAGGGA